MERVRAIALTLVATWGVPEVSLGNVAPPALGSVEWAVGLDEALRDAERARTSQELIARSDRVLALYAECPPCREATREHLRHRLADGFRDAQAAEQVEEAGLSSDPVGLSRFLLRAGGHEQARKVAADHLRSIRFVDRRLELLSVLARAHEALGEAGRARSAARRLLAEAPVSADYCRRAVEWWRLADDELARIEDALDPPTYAAYVERVHELGRTPERMAYFGCHQSNLILDLASGQAGFPGGEVPQDPVEALRLLASETPDPKVRAAILLSAATQRMSGGPGGVGALPAEALPLIRDAAACGDSASIQVGALDLERRALTIVHRDEEAGSVARMIVARYPDYLAACGACETDWYSLLQRPDLAAQVPEWSERCSAILAECPDRLRLWSAVASSYGTAREESAQVHAALLAASPPDEVVPLLLLRLSDTMRTTDPEQAWTLERKAIVHGSFSFWYAWDQRDERRERAEDREDFAAALVLEILSPPPAFGSCIPGDRTRELIPSFRQAYYRLRLGIEPGREWTRLIELLPSTPDDPSARTLHRPEYLDRLARAARAVHEEEAAVDWLRSLRQRYRELARPQPLATGVDPRQIELMLGGYIEELRSATSESGPPSGTAH